jgi:hypothetical protein
MTANPNFKEQRNGDGHDAALAANPAEVRRFLETFTTLTKAATEGIADPGLLQIGQVHPLDENSYVPTRYRLDDTELMIADAIAYSNAGHNVYIEGRTVRTGLRGNSRGAVEDTVAVFALVADDDGDKGKAANALPIQPTLLVETSPGNTHPWIFLTQALAAKEGVALGKALKETLGGDPNTGTITQPYRISGTVNYPTRTKLERGRVAVPTRLLSTTQAYSVEEFNTAFPPAPPTPNYLSDNDYSYQLDQPLAEAALTVIDPDIERREWIGIGCVLYKLFGDAVGFALWNPWSSNGDKYKQREMKKQWRSIVKGNGYGWTTGTLIHHANKANRDWDRKYFDQLEQRLFHPTVDSPMDDPNFWEKYFEKLGTVPVEETIEIEPDIAVVQPEPVASNDPEAPLPPKTPSVEPGAGLIISSRKFVAGFKPPDYLIDGLLQRRFLYSMTALTNTGKTTVALRLAMHVALGSKLGDREIEQGKVLFFAGENPDDIRMRWIKLCEEMETDPETDQVFWVAGVYSIKKLRKTIDTQTKKCGPFTLIVIDSAAAYFEGTEENSNTELGNYARMLRTLVEIDGGPTILVLSHPVKNATPDNLIPRGGGAFLNEVDGNLVLTTVSETPKVVDLHWQGKFRGPEFSPIPFMLTPGTSEKIKDSKKRLIWTVTARPLSAEERATAESQGQGNQDKLLSAMKEKENNGASLIELAKLCGWYYKSGDPNKTLANRTMHDLKDRQLVKLDGGRWKLTKAGLAVDTESM